MSGLRGNLRQKNPAIEIRMCCEQSAVFFTKFNHQFSNLFQFANFSLLGSLAIGIGTIIGIFKCHLGESACNERNTGELDILTNVILFHDIVAGIWVFRCVLWKILIPLWKYLDITCPVYEGELVKILHIILCVRLNVTKLYSILLLKYGFCKKLLLYE